MAKKNKILIISLLIMLVVGLAGTGIALAKSNAVSDDKSAGHAATGTGKLENDKGGSLQAMRRGGMRGGPGMGIRGRVNLSRIAAFLGITSEELRTQLTGGKSLADLATEKGKTAKELVEMIIAPWKEHLQIDVKYGYISQAEADALYQLRAVRMEAQISRPVPSRASASGAQSGSNFHRGFGRARTEGGPGRGMMRSW